MSLWIDKQFLNEYIFNYIDLLGNFRSVASTNYSEVIISGNYLIVINEFKGHTF